MASTRVSQATAVPCLLSLVLLAGCSTSKVPAPSGPTTIALVSAIAGSPSIIRRNQVYIIDEQSRIFPGDIIETDSTSRVRLDMADGSTLSLGNDVHLVLHAFDTSKESRTHADLALSRGAIRLSIAGTIEKGTFEVRTPMATVIFSDGDVWMGTVFGDNALDVAMLGEGSGLTITNGRFSAEVALPGEGISVIRGSGPQAVAPWPEQKIEQAIAETAIPAP